MSDELAIQWSLRRFISGRRGSMVNLSWTHNAVGVMLEAGIDNPDAAEVVVLSFANRTEVSRP